MRPPARRSAMLHLRFGRQFPLWAIFAVTTAACLAAALWQWPLGRLLLAAAAAFLVLSSLHLAAMIALWMLADSLSSRLVGSTTLFFSQPHLIPVDPSHLARIGVDLAVDIGLAVGPVIGLFVIASVGASLLQNPFHASLEKIKPNFAKLSPMAGTKPLIRLTFSGPPSVTVPVTCNWSNWGGLTVVPPIWIVSAPAVVWS